MTAAIEFDSVTKVYRRGLGGQEVPALTHVSFSVNSGEVCAFLGPNGAGKTTSISILMGFHAADWGQARVLGRRRAATNQRDWVRLLVGMRTRLWTTLQLEGADFPPAGDFVR